ncbi:27954_t:CDS:1, partial [Racocetra persica]
DIISDDKVSTTLKPFNQMSESYSYSAEQIKKFRKLWWDQENLHPKADWDNA